MRRSNPLLYVGLVITGLLAGILATLLATRPPDSGVDGLRPRVEVVELGGRSAYPPVVLPESLTARGYVDALRLNEAFKTVSAFVRPSVVFIEVETGGSGLFHRFSGGGTRSAGSGVIIGGDGFVATNHHVIEDAARITVTLSDKRAFEAEVIGDDPYTDLAVVRLLPDSGNPVENLPVVAFGDADRIEVGEWVLAVGNPFRLTSTVTAGIVSALGRQVNIIEDRLAIENFIQTDAAINPGNSGGALVNLRGELVGIATAIATESGSYEGYGFAVPVNLMQRVVRDLIEFGEVQRGYLGVTIEPVDAARARAIGLPGVRGVLLQSVTEGMSAWDAGLRSGDVLLSIEGRPVNEPNELQGAIALFRPGDRLQTEVWRDGQRRLYEVELFGRNDERARDWFAEIDANDQNPVVPDQGIGPGDPGSGEDGLEPDGSTDPRNHPNVRDISLWGLGLIDVSPGIAAVFGVRSGAYVMYVRNDGPADESGVPRNVVILAVGGTEVGSAAEAATLLEAAAGEGDAALLKVVRRDGSTAWFEMDARR